MPVVIAIVLIATIAFMLNNQSTINVDETGDKLKSEQVENIAHAAQAHATWGAQNSGCAGDMAMTTVPFGQADTGSYTATVTTPGGATTAYPNLAADQDAWFRSDQPTVNNGTTADMHLRMESGNLEYALYRFDLSSLPAGSQINSASAWLYVATGGPGGGAFPEGPLTVHRVTADWTETGATWDTMNTNYDSSVIATVSPQQLDGVWVQINLTAQVQAWVNGGEANYGIMLIPTAEGTHGKLASREATAGEQPRLDVIVGTGPATPLTITATGTLAGNPTPANDITRTLTRTPVPAYQPASNFVLQPGSEGKDGWVNASNPNDNFGVTDEMTISGGADPHHFLIEFALPAIPQNSRILSAKLDMHLEYMSSSDPAAEFSIYPMTKAWTEGTGDYWNPGDGANWNTSNGSTAWSWSSNHDVANLVATTRVNPTFDGLHSWEIKSLVQQWASGQRPNYGLLITGNANAVNAGFHSSDWSTAGERPKLTITYACECGSSCLAPQGSGTVGMVVVEPTNLVPSDAYKKALFETWGYAVNVIGENTNAAGYMTAADSNDVFYISETVNSGQVGTRIKDVPIGVVSEDGDYNPDLGFATGSGHTVESAINVTDTSHYITSVFPLGSLDIYAAGMEQLTVSGTEAPGLQTLADTGGAGSLVVLDGGADMAGGGTAAGRRVMLLLGRVGKFNWDYLNGNGRLLVQRALQWSTGNVGAAPAKNLLFVAAGTTPTAQEQLRIDLIESWGYGVNLIADDDSQANFDAAVAANDVVYISETVDTNMVGTRLTNATIGIVNEEMQLYADLDLGNGIAKVTMSQINIIDNTHSITSGFAPGLTTFVTSPQIALYISAGLAAGAQTLAETDPGIKTSLFTVEAGAALATSGNFAAGRRVQLPWGFDGFDFNALNADGQTIMQRAIEWAGGAGCGTTKPLLMLVGDATNPTAEDLSRETLLESWCYSVSTITASEPQATYDTFADNYDVVYVPSSVYYADVTSKLKLQPVGVVNEVSTLSAYLGFTSGSSGYTGTVTELTDNTHYITSGLTLGNLAITTTSTSLRTFVNTMGPGLHTLSTRPSYTYPMLMTLDTGDELLWGGNAPDRRVMLPWGGSSTFDPNNLTADGLTILQRALEWAATPPSLLPIAHWKLDDGTGLTAIDSEGGHDGTRTNGPAWTTGQDNGALDFDGTDDYVDLTSDAELDDVFVGGATVMTWIYPRSWGESVNGRILDKTSEISGDRDGWMIAVKGDTPAIQFAQGFTGVRGFWRSQSGTVALNTWVHVAVVYDASSDANDAEIYLDGVKQSPLVEITPSGTIRSDASISLRMGNWAQDTTRTFDGIIDDVRIYDRMLSVTEIANIAAGSGGGSGPPPGDGVVFEEFTQASLASNGTSMSINKPGGTAAGDLLIAVMVTDGEEKNAMSASGGWTLIDHGVESKQVSMDVWWKLAGSSEPAQYAFGWTRSEEAYGWIMRFTGHDPGNPINDSANTGGASAAPTSPSVNTTVANAMILRIGGFDDDDITVGDPGLTGHTAITMNRSGSGTGTTSGGAGYLIKAATGASGTSTFALTASEEYRAVTIGIAPAP
jgi:hypothetical protein